MTTKKTTSKKAKPVTAAVSQPLYHRLDALVHTIRCIAQYEDALCELSHEVKNVDTPSAKMNDEVRRILEKLPSHDYMLDVDSIKDILGDTATTKRPLAKKSANAVPRKKAGRG